jgi:Mg2+ and Co2+ transporter CorA
MRIFHVQGNQVTETSELANWCRDGIPPEGFVWIACSRDELETSSTEIQAALQSLCGHTLVDLHLSDLLNLQLPSHYDYTSDYDLLVFRRLTAGAGSGSAALPTAAAKDDNPLHTLRRAPPRGGPPILRRIDTSPVGFAVFDRVLLSVHPSDCSVRDAYATKLLQPAPAESRIAGARLPTSPADLMLRVVNQMVDGYLILRRELTRQLDHWQTELLSPKTRFNNWASLLDARLTLHQLEEVCEEQRSCVQDWIEAVKTWPEANSALELRERELLQIRSRDVLEHIERVVNHVRRLEHSAETAVQMHFNVQGNRTNDIMRTLTALTAIFLPLNLIAGIFGMNFEFIPLLHRQFGFWWAMGSMVAIAGGLALVFWRKRYLARSGR